MWNHLWIRVVSAIIGIAVIFLILLNDIVLMDIALCVLAIMILHEFFTVTGYKGNWLQNIVGFGFTLAIMINYMLRGVDRFAGMTFTYIVTLFVICITNSKKVTFQDAAGIFFMSLYVAITLSHMHLLRENTGMFGDVLVYMPFIGAFCSDTGAYFIGKIFGRHKLIEDVSPKKTIEGSMGGVAVSTLCMMLFGFIASQFTDISFNYLNLAILGFLSSFVAQIGDLAGSVIKREYNVKDFGNIMPGHGGILDRVDSLIAVTPFVYYFVQTIGVLR